MQHTHLSKSSSLHLYENRDRLRRHRQRKASLANSPFTNTRIYAEEPFLPAVRSKASVLESGRQQEARAQAAAEAAARRNAQKKWNPAVPHLIPAVQKKRYDPHTGKFVAEGGAGLTPDPVGIASHENDFTVPLRHASDSQLIAELARRKMTPAWVSSALAERIVAIRLLTEVQGAPT